MEEHFKNKLNDLKVDWDKEQLWEELEPKLPPQRPRLLKRRYLLLLLLFIMGSAAVVYYQKPANTTINTQSQLDILEHQKNSTHNSSSEELSLVQHSATNNNTEVQALDTETTTAITERQEQTREEQEVLENSSTVQEQRLPSTSNQQSIHVFGNNATYQNSSTTSNIKLTTQDKLANAPSKNNDAIPEPTNKSVTENMELAATTPKKNTSPVAVTKQDLSNVDYEIAPLALLDLQTLAASPKEDSLFLPRFAEINNNLAPHGLFFDLSAGLAQVNRNLHTDDLEGEYKDLLLKNKALESPWFGTSLDLGIGYQFKNGFFVKSGLQYQEIYERLNFSKVVHIDTVSQFDPKAFFEVVGNNDTIFYAGETIRYDVFEQQVFNNNKFSFMSIPLLLGFQKQFGKFSLNTSAGVNLFFASTFKGKAINRANNVYTPTLTTKQSLGYQVDLGISYQVFHKTDLFIRGSFKQNPRLNLNNLDQTYQTYHLQIGLRNFIRTH